MFKASDEEISEQQQAAAQISSIAESFVQVDAPDEEGQMEEAD